MWQKRKQTDVRVIVTRLGGPSTHLRAKWPVRRWSTLQSEQRYTCGRIDRRVYVKGIKAAGEGRSFNRKCFCANIDRSQSFLDCEFIAGPPFVFYRVSTISQLRNNIPGARQPWPWTLRTMSNRCRCVKVSFFVYLRWQSVRLASMFYRPNFALMSDLMSDVHRAFS